MQQASRKAVQNPMSFTRSTLGDRGRTLVRALSTRNIDDTLPSAPGNKNNDELINSLTEKPKKPLAFNPLRTTEPAQTVSDIVIAVQEDEVEKK